MRSLKKDPFRRNKGINGRLFGINAVLPLEILSALDIGFKRIEKELIDSRISRTLKNKESITLFPKDGPKCNIYFLLN